MHPIFPDAFGQLWPTLMIEKHKQSWNSPQKISNALAYPSRAFKVPLTVSRKELLTGKSDREFRRLVHALFGFLMRHEAIRDGHAAQIELAGAEYTVLISIAHLASESDVSVKTVADHLYVSGTFVTRIVNNLVVVGLVAKTINTKDRRRLTLSITSAGLRLLRNLAPTQRKINNAEFSDLTKGEFRTLVNIAERLVTTSSNAIRLQKHLNAKPFLADK